MEPTMSEAERVELWKLDQLNAMGFDGDSIAALLFWNVDYREARALLDSGCPHDLVLRILMPLDLPVITPQRVKSTQETVEEYASTRV